MALCQKRVISAPMIGALSVAQLGRRSQGIATKRPQRHKGRRSSGESIERSAPHLRLIEAHNAPQSSSVSRTGKSVSSADVRHSEKPPPRVGGEAAIWFHVSLGVRGWREDGNPRELPATIPPPDTPGAYQNGMDSSSRSIGAGSPAAAHASSASTAEQSSPNRHAHTTDGG